MVRRLILALDIETTGAFLERDTCFAIGYAAGYGPNEIVSQGKFVFDPTSKYPARTAWFIGDAKNALAEDTEADNDTINAMARKIYWSKIWGYSKWERRCFDEFWSKNIPTLDAIVASAGFTSEHDIFAAFDRVLAELQKHETEGAEVHILTDTTAYDTVWLQHRLQHYQYGGLTNDRDGTGWRNTLELDSLYQGANWARRCQNLPPLEAPVQSAETLHDPHANARHIYDSYFWLDTVTTPFSNRIK